MSLIKELSQVCILGALCACPTGDETPDEGVAAKDAGPQFPVQRKVLHEVFSASNCGPCFETEERLGVLWEAFHGGLGEEAAKGAQAWL